MRRMDIREVASRGGAARGNKSTMVKKTWLVRIEAEVENSDDDIGPLDDREHVLGMIKDSVDYSRYGGMLGEFETKKCKITLRLKR